MADSTQLDPVDQTPLKVLEGMLATHKPYKHDDCIPCGAVIKMGFFFDGFGRNRDHDDRRTSRYSNICRLWEAHRDNRDTKRHKMPNQFWYRFYYSGLGTELNKDAANNEIISASSKAAVALGGAVADSAKTAAEKVVGVDKLLGLKDTTGKVVKDALSDSFDEMSFRPVARAYGDLVNEAKSAPAKVGRVLNMASEDRWVRRGRAAARGLLYDIVKNPLKAGGSLARGVFAGVTMDSIPQLRDNAAIARVFGTGVEDRLSCALKQFEGAYRDAKSKMSKVQRIEVSVFGADRGGVLARAFVNELVRKYKSQSEADLSFEGDPIEIKFLGLLDAVSSLIAENKLLDFLPLVNMIKQNYGDQPLGVPAAVRRCVHFGAAHELRFYQRLDSLEKTHGDQYLYPGTSEDITGGAPAGSMGFRAELQRVALQDMLHEALMAGSAVDMMEDLNKFKGSTFRKFTLAHPISDGQTTYKMSDLIAAYRAVVPRVKGLNFQDHMQVFIHWLAVRYQSPAFRGSITSKTDSMKSVHQKLVQQRKDAEAAYETERNRTEYDQQAQGKALALVMTTRDAERESMRSTLLELARPVVSVWERIGNEAADQTQQLSSQDGLKQLAKHLRTVQPGLPLPYDPDMQPSASIVECMLMTPEGAALAQAWKDGASGKKPLPPEIMALFDLLVHDTMLTSWHDHILSSTLYFQTRATDTFGITDIKQEAKQVASDRQHAMRVDQLSKVGDARSGTALSGKPGF